MLRKLIQMQVVCSLCLLAFSVPGIATEQQGAAKADQKKDSIDVIGSANVRYKGPRWTMLYGSYQGVEEFAVNELQRMVQRAIPYVLDVLPADQTPDAARSLILVGTPAENPRIAELGRKGLIKLPTQAQGYTIACLKSPWQPETRVIVVAGTDSPGVLYGVVELNKRLSAIFSLEKKMRETFDALPEFSLTEAPVIENRGIWSWGYVIYDYKRFFDNMARLKMNRLIVWNDVPPVNARQFIDYAHSRSIKVILGFHWGWGLTKLDPTNPEHLRLVKEDVLTKYERLYKNLGMDGIYFQTFTEQSNTRIGNRTIASIACDWVNDIAHALLKKYPDLRIEWGIHASSIGENYPDLKPLDSRLTIVWEDAGGLPYSYDPNKPIDGIADRNAKDPYPAIDYSKKLATFRPGSEFSMVAKGWSTLDWSTEFENHGRFIIGERAHEYIRKRLQDRQPRWDYVNANWVKNYPYALRFYSEVRDVTPTPMTVLGLIEEGLFEEQIQIGAALLGEMLWNPKRTEQEIMDQAMTSYYRIVQ